MKNRRRRWERVKKEGWLQVEDMMEKRGWGRWRDAHEEEKSASEADRWRRGSWSWFPALCWKFHVLLSTSCLCLFPVLFPAPCVSLVNHFLCLSAGVSSSTCVCHLFLVLVSRQFWPDLDFRFLDSKIWILDVGVVALTLSRCSLAAAECFVSLLTKCWRVKERMEWWKKREGRKAKAVK